MITAEIKMGNDFKTRVTGTSIEEVIDKIKSFHSFSEFEREHYKNKGELDSIMNSGWFLKNSKTVL